MAPRSGPPPPAVLTLLDWTINLAVLSPLCVLHWRGTWQLLDHYLFPGRLGWSGLSSAALGYAVCWLCYAGQEALRARITDPGLCAGFRLLASRGYTVLFAFGLVNLWRGVWHLLDHFSGLGWESGLGSALVGVAALAGSRTLRNIAAPPLGMATDHLDEAYTYAPTMFRTKETGKSLGVHFLDVAFSAVVIGSLVVFVWRGLWTVLDVFLFPESKALSAWSSLAIGYSIMLLTFAFQPVAIGLSKRAKSKWRRVAFEDAFILFASVGAINVWRGVWYFADCYILPNDPVLSNALTTTVGMVGSILLFAGNNILARGVYLDGEVTDGSGCMISEPYLGKIVKWDATKRSTSVNEVGTRLESVVAGRPEWKMNGGIPKEGNKPNQDGPGLVPSKDGALGRVVAVTATTTPEAEETVL